MIVKERARLIGFVTTAFVVVGIIIAILASQFLAILGLIWLISTALLSGLLDAITYVGKRIFNAGAWTWTWGVKQPLLDFRYGRKKRKELEDKKVYAP